MKVRAMLVLVVVVVFLLCICSAVAGNPGDICKDNKVDWLDVKMMGENWLSAAPTPADIDNSGDVNFPDYTMLANNWGWVGPPPPEGMVLITGAEFLMGDHHGEGQPRELPLHAVLLDCFFMSRYEITNRQYCDYLNSAYPAQLKVVGGVVYASSDSLNRYPYCDTRTHAGYSQIDYNDVSGTFSVRTKAGRDMSDDPMVEVSWFGVAAYCNWRSGEEGYEACYNLSTWDCNLSKHGYRLPTEAEWEYAARGGEDNPYCRFPWGDTISHSQANYRAVPSSYAYDVNPTPGYHPDWDDGIYPYTSVVGSFVSNGYGLYDMSGNVWEWCNDWYDSDYYDASLYDNPTGPTSGSYRVLRGGSFPGSAYYSRVAYRYDSYLPGNRGSSLGFRIVLDF